jgi:asparagine synthase (glutamine-hydrolysing)
MVYGETSAGFIVRLADGRRAHPVVDEMDGWSAGGELSQYEHHDIRLLVWGHALLSVPLRSAEFAAAVDSGEISRVAGWPGSYSAVVLAPGSVTAYADLAGQFPLYYSQLNGELLLGPDPGTLACHHSRDFDPVALAAQIACPSVLPLWSERSPYSGVHRLPGGATLQVGAGGMRVWPGQPPLPAEGTTLADGADALRAALDVAVRRRCTGQQAVSADFSGGLDSTSLAFLAAAHSPRPIPSIMYHQPLAPAGDLAAATRFSRLHPRIELIAVRGSAETLPFSGLARRSANAEPAVGALPCGPEPEQGTFAVGRSMLRLAAASSVGARIHLTGEGGDALLLVAPSYLASLARRATAGTLLRHCGAYARLRFVSPVSLAARSARLARTSAAEALRDLAAELEQPGGSPPGWVDVLSWWPPCGEAATWLTPRSRRRLAEIAADPATAQAVPDGAGPADFTALTDVRRSGDTQRHLRELASGLGLAVHAPFLDDEVIRVALNVPATCRADPWSYKPLLRAAMAGLVPNEVLERRTKGDYSAESYRGARAAAGALRELLRDSRLAELGVIEPAAVRPALDRMTAGVAVPLGPLTMMLATETWLRGADDVMTGVPVAC